MPHIKIDNGATIYADYLEWFARVQDGCCRPGWAAIGNEFMFSGEFPWQTRWRGLKGSAEEKLAAFDPKLAAKLKRREITLHSAKRILLQRDCDVIARYRVARFEKAPAPYLTLVPRFPHRGRNPGHYLIMKCQCAAKWEMLTYFACGNWFWVHCPDCKAQHSFKMIWPSPGDDWFECRPTPVNEQARVAIDLNTCIPIRELEVA
jgi:hypothetical protein